MITVKVEILKFYFQDISDIFYIVGAIDINVFCWVV